MDNVKCLVLFSGKRKSGKDFISEKLCSKLGPNSSQIIRISEPIKSEWAENFNLDLKELLSDSAYKEKHRKQMIEWSDKKRKEDYGFFCRKSISKIDREIVIVSDVRRKTDIAFFSETFGDKIRAIRLNCSNDLRAERGWVFQTGVDDVASECDLDDYKQWDLEINNDNLTDPNAIVKEIIERFKLM